MAKKKEIQEQETAIGEMLSNQPGQIELTEQQAVIEEMAAPKPYIKPGFIMIKHKLKGGEIIVRETQFGRVFSTDEWEQITDVKKK